MKKLIAAAVAAIALAFPASGTTAVHQAPIGDGGGIGICAGQAGVAFTLTSRAYGIGMVPRYNSSGQLQGYDYRWGTSRWYCTVIFGWPVWNYVTGGYSVYTGWAWVAVDLADFPAV